MVYKPSNFVFMLHPLLFKLDLVVVIPVTFVCSAIILWFYPLAGYLADNKIGRYKAIIRSLQILFGYFIIGSITIIPSVFLLYCGGDAAVSAGKLEI